MKVSDLKSVFEAGRPLVEGWLDIAEEMAALRDACREKEIDWSQVKALLKAQIQDARDGSDKRVKAILSKADNATSYADALGLSSEKNISRDDTRNSDIAASATEKLVGPISPSDEVSLENIVGEPPSRDLTIPDDGSIPAFLDRRVIAS
jgi:hypothetical protein